MTLKNDLSLCTAGSVSWHLILVEEGKKEEESAMILNAFEN